MAHDAEQTFSDTGGDADIAAADTKPRTASVLGLLALTSLTLSYLGSYAVSGALVEAEVVNRWRPDADPRPVWLATGFSVLLMTFVVIGCGVRFLSQRQLRQIDEMGSETDQS